MPGNALRYGPLIYNIESGDQNVELVLGPESALTAQWRPGLLGGVVAIQGTFTHGSPLLGTLHLPAQRSDAEMRYCTVVSGIVL